ncbi:hypothetical protein NSI01_40250 [Pimelobacter simplex]|nr:hypothetical protein NSI01_40250 [Pimelobacter simplex]
MTGVSGVTDPTLTDHSVKISGGSMDDEMRGELERRLVLIEDAGGAEAALPPLPLTDLLAAVAGLVVLTLVLLWWAL